MGRPALGRRRRSVLTGDYEPRRSNGARPSIDCTTVDMSATNERLGVMSVNVHISLRGGRSGSTRTTRGNAYQNKSVRKSLVAPVVRALPLVILLVLEYRTPLDDVPSVVHSIVDLLL